MRQTVFRPLMNRVRVQDGVENTIYCQLELIPKGISMWMNPPEGFRIPGKAVIMEISWSHKVVVFLDEQFSHNPLRSCAGHGHTHHGGNVEENQGQQDAWGTCTDQHLTQATVATCHLAANA